MDLDNDKNELELETLTDSLYPSRKDKQPVRKTGLKKKQRRFIFISGMVTGILLSSIISSLRPPYITDNPKAVESIPPAAETVKPVYTEPLPIEEYPASVPDELMEGRNHSLQASEYAYDVQEVRSRMLTGGEKHEKVVFLTFDDGPGAYTSEILDILKEKEAYATFMLLGSRAEKTSKEDELWERYVKEGHALGLHTYSHDYDILYPARTPDINAFEDELGRSEDVLREIYGEYFDTRVIRYPGGSMSWNGMAELKSKLSEQSYFDIDWNALTRDSESASKRPDTAEDAWAMIQDDLRRSPNPDTVVLLMHDTKEDTPKHLGELIDKFKEEGYKFGILY